MKSLVPPFLVCALFGAVAHGQAVRLSDHVFRPHQVTASVERLQGAEVLKVVKDVSVSEVDAPTFARLQDVDFKDGTIEVKVFSRLLKTAPAMARGFIGIAFRIAEDNSKFESIYIRPTNGRAEDQLRRNRSVQYFAYPDFKFDRLRKEAAGVYETYADMGLDEWIALRIEVTGKQAKLFLNDSRQPVLVVNELKLGESTSGAIALWVDVGTEGYFKDLKISRR
jgi:hypothetical protein